MSSQPESQLASQSASPPDEESRALEVIRAHPWASLLGAVAVGFLVARIVRGER